MNENSKPRILRDSSVESLTGLSKPERNKLEAKGEFPKRIPLSARRSGWLESEVIEWIESRISNRNTALNSRRSPNPLAKQNRKELSQRVI